MNSPSNTTSSAVKIALVSLGSNLALGDRSPEELVLSAMDRLRQISIDSRGSSLYVSEPQDCPPGSADFINAAMELQVEASTTALDLLALLQQIETEFGRQRGGERNQARTLDVDLISYDNQIVESTVLTLPHPRAAQRKFVLMPLAQISPTTILPGQSASMIQLLGSLPDQDNVQLLA